jgi:hypothetical protein
MANLPFFCGFVAKKVTTFLYGGGFYFFFVVAYGVVL